MKKYIIATGLTICVLGGVFGCGKKEPGDVAEKAVPAEGERSGTKSPESEHAFIKNEQGFIVHMKDIKVLMKHLSSSINQQDWEAIKQDTKRLKNASPVVFTGLNKDDLPKEFVSLDVKFHLSALELISACMEKNKDKANAAFFKVVNSCDECHAKFNPKEAATSWFQ